MSARPGKKPKGGSAPRTTMFCYFCGGRVLPTKLHTYRCEAEAVTWDDEGLNIYDHGDLRTGWARRRDPDSGKFVSSEAST